MNKAYAAAFALIAGLLLVTAVYAHFPDGDRAGDYAKPDIAAVTKFQQDTLQLRDRLMVKKMEIHQEYAKEKPDYEKIGNLKKEVVDIRTKIAIKADEAGLPKWMGHGKGRHMMKHGKAGGGLHHCPGQW